MTRRITDLEGRLDAALKRCDVGEAHYRAAGARLWTTGGYAKARVFGYCNQYALNKQQREWVLAGWSAAVTAESKTKGVANA